MNTSQTQMQSVKQTQSVKDPINENSPALSSVNQTNSQILIQKNLPLHKLNAPETQTAATTTPDPKEKWNSLKSNLQSARDSWTALEKQAPIKSPEEEQLDKMRSLITNLKERLAEF